MYCKSFYFSALIIPEMFQHNFLTKRMWHHFWEKGTHKTLKEHFHLLSWNETKFSHLPSVKKLYCIAPVPANGIWTGLRKNEWISLFLIRIRLLPFKLRCQYHVLFSHYVLDVEKRLPYFTLLQCPIRVLDRSREVWCSHSNRFEYWHTVPFG